MFEKLKDKWTRKGCIITSPGWLAIIAIVMLLMPIIYMRVNAEKYKQEKEEKATCHLVKEWVECPHAGFKIKATLVNGVSSIKESEVPGYWNIYEVQVGLTNGGSASLEIGKKNLDEVTEMLEDLALENAKNK